MKSIPKRAFSEATITSKGRIMVMPMPTAAPLTAAMSGFDSRTRRTQSSPAGIAPLDAGLEGELHVGAGTERAPGAGHDDRADGPVAVRPPDGVRLLDGHLRRPGVQLLRAIEGNLRDPVAGLVANELVRHALWVADLPSRRVTSPLPDRAILGARLKCGA